MEPEDFTTIMLLAMIVLGAYAFGTWQGEAWAGLTFLATAVIYRCRR